MLMYVHYNFVLTCLLKTLCNVYTHYDDTVVMETGCYGEAGCYGNSSSSSSAISFARSRSCCSLSLLSCNEGKTLSISGGLLTEEIILPQQIQSPFYKPWEGTAWPRGMETWEWVNWECEYWNGTVTRMEVL